ncbi:head decoration protein [Brucella pseudogrignonensis]|uniref:Head decoration protein n=1 Tax=Brucella pseudogrignonensis TaxID=419475 RepID=A0ABU1M5H5_9HYPH|nr:head decoration protein [Brucella pseudogrignonensis]MDR6431297.1 hypothetical protein [Brucella pseudogrignonensis]
MKVFNEGRHAAEFVLTEANGNFSRDNVTVAPGQLFEAGTLLALLAVSASITAAVVATAGNAGNGTLTVATPATNSKVKNGAYRIVATSETVFSVEDPNGVGIGNATAGTAFNKEVKFTIAAGSNAFAVGDSFELLIGAETPGDFQAVAFDPEGDDGSEIPAVIALYSAATDVDETVGISVISRASEVNGHCLSWPENITAATKAAAISSLAQKGIIVR